MGRIRVKIAIAGAGIGGLAAAILLARAGHEVEVFDQFETPAPVGSGLMLQETGLAILQAMGLRELAEARGSVIRRLLGRVQPSGRKALDVRFATLRLELHAIGIQRSALFAILYQGALEAGARFTGGVEIANADGEAGVMEAASGRRLGPFDLVIDALGAHSPLSSDPRQELPFGALWASLPWPSGGPFAGDALEQRYRAARQMTGLMPSGAPTEGAPETATYFWSLAGEDERAWRSAPIDRWRETVSELWPEMAGLVDGLDHDALTFARYRQRTLARPVRGRLVHLGDSWHATSPQLGQGANMALLDAFALGQALEQTGADRDIALARYVRLRAGHIRLYQAMSFLFTPVYQSRGRVIPALRDWIAAPLMGVPPAPALLAALVAGGFGAPLKRLGLN